MQRIHPRELLIGLAIALGVVAIYGLASQTGAAGPAGAAAAPASLPAGTPSLNDFATASSQAPFRVLGAANAPVAPALTLTSSTGQSVTLADAERRGPVVIDFWATWCGPCKLELPELQRIDRSYAARGVQFYGVNCDQGMTSANLDHFFAGTGQWFPMLLDSQQKAQADYQVSGLPTVYVVDRTNHVRAACQGYDPNTSQDLPSCLNALLKES